MSIVIYTYSNPYKINKEPYWAMIKNSFHLCASQTLASGLCNQYPDFYEGKLTTITRFINILFNNWESDVVDINQRAVIDNFIDYIDFNEIIGNEINIEDIKLSLKRNRKYILKSIRIMFELGMNPANIKESSLTIEQKCVVEIYKELYESHNKQFILKSDFTKDEIDTAILETIKEAFRVRNNNQDIDDSILFNVNKDTIVVHGIHQFTPIMLKTIELLSKYKNVIILFNYVPDFKNIYETWLTVYSWFESKTNISPHNYLETSNFTSSRTIANNIAALISGTNEAIDYSKKLSIIEFDNQTEFAGYIAKKYENAKIDRKNDHYKHSTLYYMNEQIYAANSDVNNLLKIYFPEQFGERNFLDYPIGHFFIAITNMWDEETHSMNIKDINDIYECLSCGIIYEKQRGKAISIFDKCKLFFINESTIHGIIKRLKKLKNIINNIDIEDDDYKQLSRVNYFDIKSTDIDELIITLNDLNNIAESFFIDFNDQRNDFKSFYKKISDVLISKVLSIEDIDSEFRDIVQRVLERLNEVKDIEASASFDCLKETMQIYLTQVPKEGRGANWIARNFEQIDGDILRENFNKNNLVYHFACLSDQDMSITRKDEFPWPLDINFFETAQAPVDWKYQVYVTSRIEYKNFKRYALVYGLTFNRYKVILSYIKNSPDKENDLFYIFRLLDSKIEPYMLDSPNDYMKHDNDINFDKSLYKTFSQYDLMKHRLCAYRFLLESAIEGNTIYKDEFLLKQYISIIIEHRVRKEFSGKPYVKNIVHNYIVEQIDELSSDFPFINHSDIVDIINKVEKYITKNAIYQGRFNKIKENEIDYMIKRENFLSVPIGKNSDEKYKEVFKNSTQTEVDNVLNKTQLDSDKYLKSRNSLCEICADKDICLEIFKYIKNK